MVQYSGVEIWASAHRHGIADADMRHAYRRRLAEIEDEDDPRFVMCLGPAPDGMPLELGVLHDDGGRPTAIVHAMKMRPQFRKFLPGRGRGRRGK